MNWIDIDSEEVLGEAQTLSKEQKVMIMLYSSDNTINYVVKTLLEREWVEGEMRMKTYILDIQVNRELADKVAKEYGVSAGSPLAIIIKDSKPVFTALNGKVIFSELRKFAN